MWVGSSCQLDDRDEHRLFVRAVALGTGPDDHICGAVSRKLPAPIPRLALTPPEAAAAIGVGEDFFTEHVRPELQLIRRGRKVLVPVAELERWMGANAERPWGDGQRKPRRLAERSVARR